MSQKTSRLLRRLLDNFESPSGMGEGWGYSQRMHCTCASGSKDGQIRKNPPCESFNSHKPGREKMATVQTKKLTISLEFLTLYDKCSWTDKGSLSLLHSNEANFGWLSHKPQNQLHYQNCRLYSSSWELLKKSRKTTSSFKERYRLCAPGK